MLLKISIELFFLLWGQNVVDLVLRFQAGQRHRFMLRFHLIDLRFRLRLIEGVAGDQIVHRAAFFKGRTFHIFALALHDVADLLLLRIGQVQAFKHHVMLTRAAFMMHHHRLAVARRGGGIGGVCQVSRAQSQSRGNKQCSEFLHHSILTLRYSYGALPC
ncbi:hypothetical protein [Klebsiella pneumoniae IS22]|nr:hypothetical protein [Klebsiella pneumoniae IS22]